MLRHVALLLAISAGALLATAKEMRVVNLRPYVVASAADTSRAVTLKGDSVYDLVPTSDSPAAVVVQCPTAKNRKVEKAFLSYVRISGAAEGYLNIYTPDGTLVSTVATSNSDAAGTYAYSMVALSCANGRLAANGVGQLQWPGPSEPTQAEAEAAGVMEPMFAASEDASEDASAMNFPTSAWKWYRTNLASYTFSTQEGRGWSATCPLASQQLASCNCASVGDNNVVLSSQYLSNPDTNTGGTAFPKTCSCWYKSINSVFRATATPLIQILCV